MTQLRDTAPDITDDAILNGRLRLLQPKRGHRFGHDAILLGAAIPAKAGDRVAEFGAGVGAASLALLSRVTGLDATLFEIDAGLCALAQDNIARNGFNERAHAVNADVGRLTEAAQFDHVLMNPPFNDAGHQSSPDPGRRRAHAGEAGLLPTWIASARACLREGGTVTLIWRAEGLADVLNALAGGFGSAAILPVYPAPGRPAIRLIAQAEKAGIAPRRVPLRVLPPLVLNDSELQPSAEAEAILRAGGALSLTEL
jgi:tRNA1(Val) A37 N6-methylase TrmN6